MALRDKLVERAQPYLEPGEQVRHVFMGQTGPSPYITLALVLVLVFSSNVLSGLGLAAVGLGVLALVGLVAIVASGDAHVFAVTDRAIVVLSAPMWRPSKVTGIEARLPRSTRIGPVSGLWGSTDALGKKLWIHKRFHADVLAADTELAGLPAV